MKGVFVLNNEHRGQDDQHSAHFESSELFGQNEGAHQEAYHRVNIGIGRDHRSFPLPYQIYIGSKADNRISYCHIGHGQDAGKGEFLKRAQIACEGSGEKIQNCRYGGLIKNLYLQGRMDHVIFQVDRPGCPYKVRRQKKQQPQGIRASLSQTVGNDDQGSGKAPYDPCHSNPTDIQAAGDQGIHQKD